MANSCVDKEHVPCYSAEDSIRWFSILLLLKNWIKKNTQKQRKQKPPCGLVGGVPGSLGTFGDQRLWAIVDQPGEQVVCSYLGVFICISHAFFMFLHLWCFDILGLADPGEAGQPIPKDSEVSPRSVVFMSK